MKLRKLHRYGTAEKHEMQEERITLEFLLSKTKTMLEEVTRATDGLFQGNAIRSYHY
jgi:hypothetical protein